MMHNIVGEVAEVLKDDLIDMIPAEFNSTDVSNLARQAAEHCATVFEIKNTDWMNKVGANVYMLLTNHRISPKHKEYPLKN
ncbi:MAG: hypothetical protein F6K56_46290 [Moorea sp. SIO3G5]|nr:hypothetical protein [Moorena sp. SIO3G5]